MSEVSLYSWIALLRKYTSFEVEFSSSIYIVLTFKGENNVCVCFFFFPVSLLQRSLCLYPKEKRCFKTTFEYTQWHLDYHVTVKVNYTLVLFSLLWDPDLFLCY